MVDMRSISFDQQGEGRQEEMNESEFQECIGIEKQLLYLIAMLINCWTLKTLSDRIKNGQVMADRNQSKEKNISFSVVRIRSM